MRPVSFQALLLFIETKRHLALLNTIEHLRCLTDRSSMWFPIAHFSWKPDTSYYCGLSSFPGKLVMILSCWKLTTGLFFSTASKPHFLLHVFGASSLSVFLSLRFLKKSSGLTPKCHNIFMYSIILFKHLPVIIAQISIVHMQISWRNTSVYNSTESLIQLLSPGVEELHWDLGPVFLADFAN